MGDRPAVEHDCYLVWEGRVGEPIAQIPRMLFKMESREQAMAEARRLFPKSAALMIGKVTYLGVGHQPTASLTFMDPNMPEVEVAIRFIPGESPEPVP